MKSTFTTGQVAKICKVAPRTVSKWFDSGRLRGYRIPGSQDRRIPREHLIRFLKEHGMPLGELEDEATGKILLVGLDQTTRDAVTTGLDADRFKAECAETPFWAAIKGESLHPDCVVIDFALGRDVALLLSRNLHAHDACKDAIQIALHADVDKAGFDRELFKETFCRPFDSTLLVERIQTLVRRLKQLA